jgi:hypothetical protein
LFEKGAGKREKYRQLLPAPGWLGLRGEMQEKCVTKKNLKKEIGKVIG